jgi:UDP-glucuronate decarboxylase
MNPKTIFSVFVKNAITHQTLTLRGKGSRVQNFLHVTDIAFCVSNSLKYTVRGIFHIGGTSVSNLVLAQKCIALTNSHSKILFEGIDSEDGVEWKPICNKAQEELHFIPTISLDDAIKEYAEHCVSL